MSGRNVNTCHKTRVVKCKGVLAEDRKAYGKWAYWCKDNKHGWASQPCDHQHK